MKLTVEALKKKKWIIHEVIVGSHLHNTTTPESDIDIRGIFNVPIEDYLLDKYSPVVSIMEGKEDIQYYEAIHFIKLLRKGSPGIVDILFADNIKKECNTKLMCYLINDRDKFITKRYLNTVHNMVSHMLYVITKYTERSHKDWKLLYLIYRFTTLLTKTLKQEKYISILSEKERLKILNIRTENTDYHLLLKKVTKLLNPISKEIETSTFPTNLDSNLYEELILKFKLDGYRRL